MPAKKSTSGQELFKDMFVGILLYAVVMGFFNDYTDILDISSFSTVFLAAVVMQVLTYLTFKVKDIVADWFKKREGIIYRVGLVIGVWLVIFLSKFVFLEVIDIVFGSAVEISGFFGLMAIIIVMTIIEKLSAYFYRRLA